MEFMQNISSARVLALQCCLVNPPITLHFILLSFSGDFNALKHASGDVANTAMYGFFIC